MILTLKCDQASVLMSDSLDRPLLWHERLALRGHLLACRVCPLVMKQMKTIAQATRRVAPPEATLSRDAKDRIKGKLRES